MFRRNENGRERNSTASGRSIATILRNAILHKVKFNSRLRTTGGRYLLKSHNVELNYRYYEMYGKEELIGIIKHELCHYHLHITGRGYKHRDRDFRELLKKVDAPRFCKRMINEEKEKRFISMNVWSVYFNM